MRIRTTAIAAAAIGLTVLTGVALPATASTASAAPATRLALPRPTGPDAVGLQTLHLVDRSRTDPWVPSSGARQLMVSMYYPAIAATGRRAPYMSTAEASALLAFAGLDSAIPATTFANTTTWARTDAAALHGRYPLVVLSPGFSVPRYELTGLAVDLASHGFVVASVDHAYESQATAFPGAGILPCVACDGLNGGTIQRPTIVHGRALDISFVIDQVTGKHATWPLAGLIDAKRIGMAGHSIGGDAAPAAMTLDHRILAGASLDGPFTPLIPATGLNHRPFLLLGDADAEAPGVDPTWDASWPSLDGWRRWLTVSGADHYTFTDLDFLVDQSGALAIPGADRSVALTRAYVTGFFQLQLKGSPQPLLNGPSDAFPEVTFNDPGE